VFCPKCGASNGDPIDLCRGCGTNLKPIAEALTALVSREVESSPAKYVTGPITTESLGSHAAVSPPGVAPTIIDPTVPAARPPQPSKEPESLEDAWNPQVVLISGHAHVNVHDREKGPVKSKKDPRFYLSADTDIHLRISKTLTWSSR
jgi:hypothetical protein